MKIKIIILVLAFLSVFSCVSLSSCPENIEGKYICSKELGVTNYVLINKDKTFIHYYEEEGKKITHEGNWWWNKSGDCSIELSEWKNFNQKGFDYETYGNGFLFINNNELNMTPDGPNSFSYKRVK